MPRSSLRHKIDMGYVDPTYTGDRMRMPIANIGSTGSTISKTAPAATTISNLTGSSIQAGETFTFTLNDPSGLFTIVGSTLMNKNANVPAGSYPVTITTKGSLGSNGTLNMTIVSS